MTPETKAELVAALVTAALLTAWGAGMWALGALILYLVRA